MWLFTPRGFFTVAAVVGDVDLKDVIIPEEYKDTVNVMVRARVKSDLEGLKGLWELLWPEPLPPIQTLRHDYPYRMVMPRKRWALLVENMAEEIDYRKFKDAVSAAQGPERYSLYVQVWSVLYDAERKLADWLKRKTEPFSLSREARYADLRDPGYDYWLDEDYRQAVVQDPPVSRTVIGRKIYNTGTGLREDLVTKKRGR